MTKEEFTEAYLRRSEITDPDKIIEHMTEHLIALPCKCEDEGCPGWQMSGRTYHNLMGYYDLNSKWYMDNPEDVEQLKSLIRKASTKVGEEHLLDIKLSEEYGK